jgi:hypothetical protein
MIARTYSVLEVKIDTTLASDEGLPSVPALKVSATGMVNSGGWSNPELGVWSYIDQPSDGILDMDFLANPPEPGTMVTMGFQRIPVNGLFAVPDWVQGVRIHSATNSIEARLSGPLPSSDMKLMGDGMPLPWPFPWYRPQSKSA